MKKTARENHEYWLRCALSLFLLSVALGALAFYFGASLFRMRHLARQDLSTHTNLYYQMWKDGDRRFEAEIAFGGLLHDLEYREKLIGMSKEEFHRLFPGAFHEVTKLPPAAKPGQLWFVTDYRASRDGNLRMHWVAVFDDDRLTDIHLSK